MLRIENCYGHEKVDGHHEVGLVTVMVVFRWVDLPRRWIGCISWPRLCIQAGLRLCHGPISGTTHLTDLVNFSLFILSYLTISDFKPWGDSLWELTYLMPFTISQNTCMPHGEPCSIKLNLILDSSFLCCTWLCYHIHAHHTCSMLLFHSATAMQLHHVINLHYACPRQYQ